MNKTFKVVFNKARGALMVVNEATSSVQKKGTKTVIVAAVAAMMTGAAGVAVAENTTLGTEDTDFSISGKDYPLNYLTAGEKHSVVGKTVSISGNKRGIQLGYGAALDVGNVNGTTKSVSIAGLGDLGVIVIGSKDKEPVLNLLAKDFITITAPSIGLYSQGVYKEGKYDAENDDYVKGEVIAKPIVDIDAYSVNVSAAVGIVNRDGAQLGITGTEIDITGETRNAIENVYGGNLNITSSDYVKIKGGTFGILNITSTANISATDLIEISGDNTGLQNSGIIHSDGNKVIQPSTLNLTADEISISGKYFGLMNFEGAQTTIIAKKFSVEATDEEDGKALHNQNSTQAVNAMDGTATVKVIADEITVKSPYIGVFALSNSKTELTGKTTITAKNAILTRGNSTVNVNAAGEHVTKITGDIIFETPNTPGNAHGSGNLINSHVTIGLHGAESFWEGSAYMAYGTEEDGNYQETIDITNSPYHGEVRDFIVNISDNAKWIITGDSFINTLNLQGLGNVVVKKEAANGAFSANKIYVTGSGNTLQTPATTKIEDLTLEGGLTINGAANVNALTMKGGSLTVAKVTGKNVVVDAATVTGSGNVIDAQAGTTITKLDVNGALTLANSGATYGAITIGEAGQLTSALDTLFKAESKDGILTGGKKTVGSISGNGELVITTAFKYTNDGMSALSDKTNGFGNVKKVTLEKASLYIVPPAAGEEGDKDITIGDNVNANLPAAGLGNSLAAGADNLDVAGTINVVAGEDNEKQADFGDTTINVSGSMNVADNVEATANKIVVAEGGVVQIGKTIASTEAEKPATGESGKIALKELDVKGTVLVGGNGVGAKGVLAVEKLTSAKGSVIFADPAWNTTGLADVTTASGVEIAEITGDINGAIIAGQQSLIALGDTLDDAQTKVQKVIQWGNGADLVGAALFVNAPVKVGDTGAIIVNNALTAVPATIADGTVMVADRSAVVIDQAKVGETVFEGASVTFADGSTLGVLNAAEGALKLGETQTLGKVNVNLDNQFMTPTVKDNALTINVDEQKLAGAVASMGVQQMARRADTVIANTIADRTAQTIAGEGVSIWADVGGERYEADDLDNGAQYKANMFYGAFGADVGITPNARVGAAIQYGTGDSKSDNYNIKNDIDAVSLALYGSYNVTDAAKIVGEFAWTKTSNDVTSSERLLKNDIDADVISLGVRGQHEFKVGALNIVPSLGLRVSRISTDAFNVGAVKVDVDDQTLVQIPLSVSFSADIEQAGWTMKPYAKVSFTPSFGDDEINVRGYDQSSLDTMPVQGDFGLSATNGNVTFGAALSAGFGQDGAKNFGGKVNVRYAF